MSLPVYVPNLLMVVAFSVAIRRIALVLMSKRDENKRGRRNKGHFSGIGQGEDVGRAIYMTCLATDTVDGGSPEGEMPTLPTPVEDGRPMPSIAGNRANAEVDVVLSERRGGINYRVCVVSLL